MTTDDLRVGDTERDAVATALHDHFAQGRLDRGELEERLDGVLSAKTTGDLRRLVADLPGPNGLPEPEFPFRAVFGPLGGREMQHAMRQAMRTQARAQRDLHRGFRHGRPHHHRQRAVFPLLALMFAALLWTAGIGAAFAAVFTIALVAWTGRAFVHARRRHGSQRV
ncbi:hypothetical protein BTM25_51210 [Actinomadura rubteroloni]|uniref:DUF1707 domain-containing protein n=1 Tax=Actinomadura rubteroloni TaxID=1926885 RepID=A0A2P4UCX9_9ACTN|nr:DUF1707 domain-containing protein [Actinomadura rubteroloni]POM22915.1 hypothetical protein BTM25_51210 [Actinomadura rubteroloni]